MSEVQGTCDSRFAEMRDVLEASLESGADLGASVAVTIDGSPVVDLWGGWADSDKTKPWVTDTITNVWSTTKTMTNLCALLLVDRGELDVFAPVSKYWPEFAANGKESIEVRHVLSHTSGVSAWEQPVQIEDLYDWDKSTAMLASQAPWWKPGTASGYHAINQGHLVGELIRRISGRSLGTFFADEVAKPLGADFHIGLSAADDRRVSNVVAPPPIPIQLEPGTVAFKTLTGPPVDANYANTEAWRRAQIGAANGHGNARSVARIQSVVACGGEVDGVRLLSPATIDLIFEEQAHGVDLVLGLPLRFGIGYGLPEPKTIPYIPDGRICFWGGWGGSVIVVDLDHRMTIAYMMNVMEPGIVGGLRAEALLRAAYSAVAAIK
jgi:CubicO group peptidase (beta-lactamase class C family)